ncbi:DUF924 family protein [Gallaecimonas sp. GXIMD4217]|uniref:DUF924 family protein n=1 Tax=Gallaecimonas sp. GXIMD4217 TaxID=3131927 RepID=UPI00311B0223
MDAQQEILDFWFGELDDQGMAGKAAARRWYQFDPGFDLEIKTLFEPLLRDAIAGELEHWRDSPRGRLALVLLLDQFSRQIWRGTPRAFAQDELAQALVEEGLSLGQDDELALDEKRFFYMPLMHAENLALQELSVQCVERLLAGCTSEAAREAVNNSLHFAREHRDIIARFGRFPHRNRILGRQSSPQEQAYLAGNGQSYGQG